MESKKAREPIFGIVACSRGGARYAHLKGVIDAFPLKARLGKAEDTPPPRRGLGGGSGLELPAQAGRCRGDEQR